MKSGGFRFDRFHLNPGERQFRRDGVPVELNARYLDALALLVAEQGRLVTKDRFLDQVWRGVPVTDEALTQCIKTLRRQLGDDAGRPRFIETVPKHGYRFVAPVEVTEGEDGAAATPSPAPSSQRREFLLLGTAGTIGALVAGLLGGLFYGFAGASPPAGSGGAISSLLVLVALTLLLTLIGGAAVSFGIAASRFPEGPRWAWNMAGGAAGGLIVGAIVKLLGIDAFNLLFGRSPGDITGAPEGLLLGGAVGLGTWLGSKGNSLRASAGAAALAGAAAGVIIALLGGHLLGGSLALHADQFPQSRLRLDQLSALFGEPTFGRLSEIATAGLEGALFGGCIGIAMALARRRLAPAQTSP